MTFLSSGGWEVHGQGAGLADLVSGEGSHYGLQTAIFNCIHTALRVEQALTV